MTFKKILGIKKAQASVEYIILFAIIATLTLIGITEFFPRLRESGETFFNRAMDALH